MASIISGNVVLSNVSVFCQPVPAQAGTFQQTTSDSSGNYAFAGLQPGVTYRITAFLAGTNFGPSKLVTINPLFATEAGVLPIEGQWALVSHATVPADV